MLENREAYIKYRLQRADDTLEEALILCNHKRWNAAVNRLYYSCYYAVSALLLKNNIKSNTHDGTRNQFGLHFIKTNKIDKVFGKIFSRLFDYRQKGDYDDLYDFNAESINLLIQQTELFLKEIKKQF
jgi:uncharacterized protein (UPF0332 family)